jgi:hypothetical protein
MLELHQRLLQDLSLQMHIAENHSLEGQFQPLQVVPRMDNVLEMQESGIHLQQYSAPVQRPHLSGLTLGFLLANVFVAESERKQ